MSSPKQALGPREVIVRIVQGADGKPEARPPRFHVSKGMQQVVVWECPVDFAVVFNESPFYESQFDQSCDCSGLVRRGVLPNQDKPYKYSIYAWGQVTDPDGIVDR